MELKFNYIAITNKVEDALALDRCGIQQIMVDTEILGKAARQSGWNTEINSHKVQDICKIKDAGVKSKVICRINGYHQNISDEINDAINAGADTLMFPMIHSVENLNVMVDCVNKKVPVLPLIETPYSVFKLKEIIDISRPDQIHFGLNDLYISLRMRNLFEVLVSPIFSEAVKYVRGKVDLIGIGGIGDPLIEQRIDPFLLLNEYKLLGSRSVILSRSFFPQGYSENRIMKSLGAIERVVNEECDSSLHNKLILEVEKF
jgi:hypothetical protein